MDREIRKQDVPREGDGCMQFLFLVKFYPEDVEEELIQNGDCTEDTGPLDLEKLLPKSQELARIAREREERLQIENERNQLKAEVEKIAEQLAQAKEAARKTEETAELLAEKARASEQETLMLTKRVSEAEAECHRLQMNHVKSEEALMRMERKAREAELYAQRISMSLADVNTKPHYASHALITEPTVRFPLLPFCKHDFSEKARLFKERLDDFRNEIDAMKREDRQTEHDVIHIHNMHNGFDKFTTLRM
ncbi:Ezrin/radixin/moesin family protein, partial [Teladorsagia circumcincta]